MGFFRVRDSASQYLWSQNARWHAHPALVESEGSVTGGVRRLYPQCINPEAACRRLSRRVKCVHGVVRMVCGLVPPLFGAQPSVNDLRVHLNTQNVLVELRSLCVDHLEVMSAPCGFRPRLDGSRSQRAPPTLNGRSIQAASKGQ